MNQYADALATLKLMIQISCNEKVQVMCIKIKNIPAYCFLIEEEIDENP